MSKLSISGTGCALLDYLYPDVSFTDPKIMPYLSKEEGDGGIDPGKLVFTDELEKFAGKAYGEILGEITENKAYEAVNIGGPSVVSLIHLSQLIGNRAEVRFYGVMGKDLIARDFFRLMGKVPLDISSIQIVDGSSPFTHVLSDPGYHSGQGERSFINNIGSAAKIRALPDDFYQGGICAFGGTALVPGIHDQLDEHLKKASLNRSFVVVNTVYDFRNQKRNPGKPWPLGKGHHSLDLIDLLIMDEEESLKISAKKDSFAAREYFAEKGVKGIIITRGPKPVLAYASGTTYGNDLMKDYPVSAHANKILNHPDYKGDTTGCGDNFAGGVLYSLADQIGKGISKPDLEEMIRWGNASGVFALSYSGGTWYEQYAGEKKEKVSSLL